MNDDALHLRLLGRLELADGSGAIALPGAVSRAIVGRLLLAGGAVVRRDTLIDESASWPVSRSGRLPGSPRER